MESNFIKERIVVREHIIKKNVAQDKDKSKSKLSEISLENTTERIARLEELVNEELKQDLAELSKRVDLVCQKIADYIKIKSALKVFKANPRDVRLLTNIGCNFYAQCQVEDASRIYLCLGMNYFLEMNLDEAITMIEYKEKQLMSLLDSLQERASSIKACIKIALEAMGKVYDSDHNKLR